MDVQVWRCLEGLTPLCASLGLHLAPSSRLTVRLRARGPVKSGESVSSLEAGERLRELVRPDSFASLRVTSADTDGLSFEAEAEGEERARRLVRSLNGKGVRLRAFAAPLDVDVRLHESDGPTRRDWDDFFRRADGCDEKKPGERPDTLHLTDLPSQWFSKKGEPPSEALVSRAFERFGRVRRVDVPVADPFRVRMKPTISGVTVRDSPLRFEAYVQFEEYAAFSRAAEALRGSRLVKKDEDGETRAASFRWDFDRTKHLSDASVKRREIVRERLTARDLEERKHVEAADPTDRSETEDRERQRLARTEERERRRKERQLAKLKKSEASEIDSRIEREKRKLLKTQRKLQSIRLLEELFRRLGAKRIESKNQTSKETAQLSKADGNKCTNKIGPSDKVDALGLVCKLKCAQELELEERRLKIQKALEGKDVLRSVLDTVKRKASPSSLSSLSSASDIESKDSKLKQKKNSQSDKDGPNKSELENLSDVPNHNFGPYIPHRGGYGYPLSNNLYPRSDYYPPDVSFGSRSRGFALRRNRGPYVARGYRNMSFYEGSEAKTLYYRYFKSLAEGPSRKRSRSRSKRSYTRSRSRSRKRRSRSRRSSSSSRHSRRSRNRSRSYSRSRSRSRRSKRRHSRSSRSRSSESSRRNRNRRSRSRSRSRSSSRKTRSRSSSRKTRSRSSSRRKRSKNSSRKTRSRSSEHEKSRGDSKENHSEKNKRAQSTDREKSEHPSTLSNDNKSKNELTAVPEKDISEEPSSKKESNLGNVKKSTDFIPRSLNSVVLKGGN